MSVINLWFDFFFRDSAKFILMHGRCKMQGGSHLLLQNCIELLTGQRLFYEHDIPRKLVKTFDKFTL